MNCSSNQRAASPMYMPNSFINIVPPYYYDVYTSDPYKETFTSPCAQRMLIPNTALEIYYDLKSALRAALLRTILILKYSTIPLAKIVITPYL